MHERRFNPASMHKLDRPERRKTMPPGRILQSVGLQQDDIVLDIGAGTGYFALEAAKLTSQKVYVLDAQQEMLDELNRRAKEQGIDNIENVLAEAEELPLPDESVDFVIASMVLHELEPLSKGLKGINRVLKPGGKLLALDWEKRKEEQGPPEHHRIHSSDMEYALTAAGMIVNSIEHLSPSIYKLVSTRP